jgi:SAM-dependent methyltransferase
MARKHHDALPFDTIRLEGALFVPDLLERLARGEGQAQESGDFHLPKGITLADEQGRAFQIARAQWLEFTPKIPRQDLDTLTLTLDFVRELLTDSLHYTLERPQTVAAGGRIYPVPLMGHGRVPVFVAPHSIGLDESSDLFPVQGSGSRRRSVFRLAQEFLNASSACTWAMVSNGRRLRLLRDAATLTRPCFLEFDLETILDANRYPDFVAFWRLLHGSRAGAEGTAGHACIWEEWRNKGLAQGTRVRDGLREGVTQALIVLGNGFLRHPSNGELRARLQDGTLTSMALFQELLRLVYRCLFLFTLEERTDEAGLALLHPPDTSLEGQTARRLYCEGYSLKRLRARALRPSSDRYHDLWQGVVIVFRALYQGEPRLALPALGGLFAPDQCPNLDACSLGNQHLLAAIRRLRWAQIDGKLSLVDYRNMGPEELGSIYESLLELVPSVDPTAGQFGFVGITDEGDTAGHARKTTGSYYTPDSLVQELIKSALDPVIAARIASRPDAPADALLELTVLDPACGSGHFLLAAARRLAEQLAELRAIDGGVRLEDYRRALREVISRCIFGVDKNPMALELARFALWLEGFEPGRPLSFLNHHLLCGDALLGLMDFNQLKNGIPQAAFKALSGDDKITCQTLAKENREFLKTWQKRQKQGLLFSKTDTHDIWQQLAAIERLPESSVQEIEAKAGAYAAFVEQTDTSPLHRAADCFVGALLVGKENDQALNTTPTTFDLLIELLDDPADERHQQRLTSAQDFCAQNRVLHWPLVFPRIVEQGGFDCILANPPWERIKLQEEEFFATRHPDVAAAKNKAERGQRITWLAEGILAYQLAPEYGVDQSTSAAEKQLYRDFIEARRTAEAASLFAHLKKDSNPKKDEGGRFPLTGVGDVNTYPLFAESISQLTASQGRAGFIVPTGIATDDSTKAYFAAITQGNRLISLYDFENRDAIFPGVHRSYKFCLLTLGSSAEARFSFFLTQTEQLNNKDRTFTLHSEDFLRINPNTQTCPVFRSRMDAELTRKIYSHVPVLIREGEDNGPDRTGLVAENNPWGMRFMAMFHMSNDSHFFADTASPERVPLYEAKMAHQFDHRWASYRLNESGDPVTVDVTLVDKQNPDYRPTPRYWVSAREVLLRTANLPKGLLQGLRENNTATIIQALAHLLFGQWLIRQGMGTAAQVMARLYPSWRKFIDTFPFAADVAPAWLGLCDNTPLSALLMASNPSCLPAEPVPKITQGPSNTTAWYPANEDLVAGYIDSANTWHHALDHNPTLLDAEAALAFAEQLLDSASPKWLMGWRRNARSNDERTTISFVMPTSAIGDSIFLMRSEVRSNKQGCLIGNLNSMVLDFVARQKVGGVNYSFYYIKQLPVLPPDHYTDTDLDFIVPRVLELTYTTVDLHPWAEDLGYSGPPFGFDLERRAQLRAELDAYFAWLYGLTRDELRYILDPAAVMGEDYPSETFRVLKNNELRQLGEYRTQRLVLEAWDKQSKATYPVDSQLTYHENPQIFPWPGRERFLYHLIPHLVRAKAGMQFEYYRDAALLASRPEYLRQLLSPQHVASFDALPQNIKDACTFPLEHHVRSGQLRRRLAANGQIDIDAANGATQLGEAVDVLENLPGMDQLLPFILEAADNLRQHQVCAIEALDTRERAATTQAAQFLQAAVG